MSPKLLLLPLSALYGLVVGIRNFMYDKGIFKSISFSVPIICVGNISVGGTGKTPFTEYIISHLILQGYNIAYLSRGYKRLTSGFIVADKNSTPADIGDEPFQVKQKFPNITVACDADRVRGVQNLLKLTPVFDVIILDDAFQHRHIKAGYSIVLVDYNNMIDKDFLLPAGRLRECAKNTKRADFVVVTKYHASSIDTATKAELSARLNIEKTQGFAVAGIRYSEALPVFPKSSTYELDRIRKEDNILCITGIAKPQPYIDYLKTFTGNVNTLIFPDHHNFSRKDVENVVKSFAQLPSDGNNFILTTEKDAVRFQALDYVPDNIKGKMYYTPIKPEIIEEKSNEELFGKLIEYVEENKG
ncbi:MAG: tetraacyldisaccharide 4'-kinase [Culturomica sp.]|jgi:tetraacyldisaccharide 4'-kinase|nr:tetraacyldisaccharide 4'-kinase [Culturomica sp.]